MLGRDRQHVTLGRAAPPTEGEIATASAALAAQGLGGWIATLDGSYWGRSRMALAPVQAVGADVVLDRPAAVTAFLDARQRAWHSAPSSRRARRNTVPAAS